MNQKDYSYQCFCKYCIFHNPTYIGKVRHKKNIYDGVQEGFIDQKLWDQVQAELAEIERGRHKALPLLSHYSMTIYFDCCLFSFYSTGSMLSEIGGVMLS